MKQTACRFALALVVLGCGDETGPGSGFGGASAATTGAGGDGGGDGAGGGSASSAGGGMGQGGGPSSFSCGPLIKCNAPTHHCEEFHPGVPGGDIVYECKELPAACGVDPSCACLMSTPDCTCAGSGNAGLTVTCFGA